MKLLTPWWQLAIFSLGLGSLSARAESLEGHTNFSEEELLKDWVPEPEGVPLNDPWALSLVNGCPQSCNQAGWDLANWTQLYDREHLSLCDRPLLFGTNAHNAPDRYATILACALGDEKDSKDTDAINTPSGAGSLISREEKNAASQSEGPPVAAAAKCGADESTINANVMVVPGSSLTEDAGSDAISAADALVTYIGSNAVCGNMILFAKSGAAVAGLYAGADIKKDKAAELLRNHLPVFGSGIQALEICASNTTTSNTVGVFVASGVAGIDQVQQSLKSWSDGICLPVQEKRVLQQNAELGVLRSRFEGAKTKAPSARHLPGRLRTRAECRTRQVDDGDSCASLATKCGISGADFTDYNKGNSKLCSTLMKGQWVCCSSGTLPDKRPKPDQDGGCATVQVEDGGSCSAIAANYGLTIEDLDKFNKNTWGWRGCSYLQKYQVMCVSKGTPPMPAPVNGVTCGPQKPGTKKLTGSFTGKDLAKLNPCPLNACCSGWGFCGTTAPFCTESPADTGAPGAHKPGTNGCISNCDMAIRKNAAPPSFFTIGYFEGYGLSKACDRVDIRTVDVKKYTHLHFAFATVTADDYQVDMGPTTNQFYYFKRLKGVKKVLAFGGWTFSTDPKTYGIFRTGVSPAYREKMAHNIANFIVDNDLDGVDIDWEYPAAPDLPDIPAGDKIEGVDYLKFLITLRNALPREKSLSFAAPASYWYLKGFPIAAIIKVVDYVVYMTYDLHGQWDHGNKWSSEGCAGGNCLRSHVNLTETENALSMITKAGAPSNKIVVGVASYGRSFKMSQAGCTRPDCTYTGPQSGAKKGRCTDTAGYISNSEIDYILKNNPSAKKTYDKDSDSDILVYDDTEWVAYMDDGTKNRRKDYYKSFNFLGTSDWAVSLDGNAGLVEPDSSKLGDDDDYSVAPKGASDLKIHESCQTKDRLDKIWEAWYEAGELSKAPYKWSRWNKYQRVLNNYLAKKSGQVPIIGVDHIWENFKRHNILHFGGRGISVSVNTYIYCDESKLPKKVQDKYNVLCYDEKKGHRAAVTYRFPGTWFWSDYYILLCPTFLSEEPSMPKFTSLKELKSTADGFPLLQKEINRWSSGVRAVTLYHEVAHFQDVSNPFCDKNEEYRPKAIVVMAQSGLSDDYEFNLRNAHSWALSALGMWMMQQWPDIDVPMPRRTKPQRRADDDDSQDINVESLVDPDDNFDASRVNPKEFKYLSALKTPNFSFGSDCEEGEYGNEDQCRAFCSWGGNGKCAKNDKDRWECSNCKLPTKCESGVYDSSEECFSNCKDGQCFSNFECDPFARNCPDEPIHKCECPK